MLYGVVGDDFVHNSAMDKDDVDDDDVLVEENWLMSNRD
mgnify:CR=1 FL=1